jgi:hypothetical protein
MLSLVAATLFAVCLLHDYAHAQASTCSGARDACRRQTAAASQRGTPSGHCDMAHAECMKTGVWDTKSLNQMGRGVKRSGLSKQ